MNNIELTQMNMMNKHEYQMVKTDEYDSYRRIHIITTDEYD